MRISQWFPWFPRFQSMSRQALGSRLLIAPRFGTEVGSAAGRVGPRGATTQESFQINSWQCARCRQHVDTWRYFSASVRRTKANEGNGSGPFRARLRVALKKTKIEWSPIPVGLGIGFLGLLQFYRTQSAKARLKEEDDRAEEDRNENAGKPKKRKRIRPSGPWYARPSPRAGCVAKNIN